MSDLPEKIGKYEITGLAGEGNMGIVYIAHDPFEDREVAVKVCRIPDDTSSELRKFTRKIFYNEAHSAGVLKHPNILQIFDAGEDEGQPYIVMEYVEGGETLKSYTTGTNLLPVKSVVEIFYQCAKALDYAHRKGVIHRDIKPTNIMLTRNGEVKIADFGIAHNAAGESTQVMGLMGSPRYMSPEQVQEEEVTNKTDLYSLGIVAYELLSGKPPFLAKTIPQLVRKIIDEPAPSPRELRPELPGRLEDILDRVMQKKPERRHGSGQELAADLASVFGELDEIDEPMGDTVKELTHTKKFEIARELEFFNDFSDEELDETVRACSWQSYRTGEMIVKEGAEDRAFFIVAGGEVAVSINGKEIATLTKGACFGEMGYLSKTRRTATVAARDDVNVLKIDATLLDQTSVPCQLRFNQVLMKILLERLAQTSDRLAQFVN
ncbi:MAG: serine/threonine-protein kinase [Gammaproteobacteria bacterium]|nr:serine/threonine-protein kinase [Gammaproteobacteria bacterium]